jgi:hypothetical protein
MKNKSEDLWQHVETLPWCTLVTTGRTGTDFFQSLLDSHPEIFVFNGALFFHTFWNSADSVNHGGELISRDIVDEFIGHHLKTIKSKYDIFEKKGFLGKEKNQSIDIDTDNFKQLLLSLIDERPINSRNFLTAVYVSYTVCVGQDVMKKKIFFHHIHHIRKLGPYMADFPDSKVICMTRDPRAAYVSGVENWRKADEAAKNPSFPQYILWRILDEARPLLSFNKDSVRALKLEDLANQEILGAVCMWLGVSFHPCMLESTWAGLRWWGDQVSQNKISEKERGFSKTMTNNKWEEKIPSIDKFVFNYITSDALLWFGYESIERKKILNNVLVLLAIFLPTKYEREYLSISHIFKLAIRKDIRSIFSIFYHYSRRVYYYYDILFRNIFKKNNFLEFFSVET